MTAHVGVPAELLTHARVCSCVATFFVHDILGYVRVRAKLEKGGQVLSLWGCIERLAA